jgi:hypothetical protein
MIAFDVDLNGQEVCQAAVGENGVLSAIVNWVVRSNEQAAHAAGGEISLHVGGLAGPQHYTWIPFQQLKVGDVVCIRIVEVDSADDAIRRAHVKTAPDGQPGWFDQERARLRKADR